MVEAAKILNIEAPDLYVRQSPVPNAYTLAISGKKPFVVVHTSLVELLTRKELQVMLFSVFTCNLLFALHNSNETEHSWLNGVGLDTFDVVGYSSLITLKFYRLNFWHRCSIRTSKFIKEKKRQEK